MDMQTIQQKMTMTKYEALEDMVTDFVLLFDNACKYNEPESVIYRVSACRVLCFCGFVGIVKIEGRLRVNLHLLVFIFNIIVIIKKPFWYSIFINLNLNYCTKLKPQ